MQARSQYHAELDHVWQSLYELAELARLAMVRGSLALEEADLQIAEQVIAGDVQLDTRRAELDELVFTLLATQQPVATDLRLLTATIPAAAGLERMGDLAAHVARAARLRYPDHAVPEPLRATITGMGEVAVGLAADVAAALASRDPTLAARVPAGDEEMTRLHRQMFALLLAEHTGARVNTAIDVSLLGRYFERYADQAVSVARRVYFVITAEHLAPVEPREGWSGGRR
ncbi:phosphate signaling complex protein PhoU [Jatrophihabitans telluris]|uniref:Phosphate-specific transport system accessory protein PhoU n=1 Tax=Jatrophihabitans telluris TaxID=2038343 RepID=A0ABY4QVZ1_9ACTN|nr:phosphate signaling complex protein PhoU [Jatrophihabitans telluris]UQX87449.1 phosphate signaling complex protein PhoU [Jatrophihabitans telluris]